MLRPIEAIYLFDPLCGWCYGAAPMIEALAREPGLTLDMVPVGLFAKEGAFTITPAFAQYVRDADARIAQITGQPFSDVYREKILGKLEGLVDSGPATLALTAVRLENPADELKVLKRLQLARYVDGVNISTTEIAAEVLHGAGFAAAAARVAGLDEALLKANTARIETGRDLMRRFDCRGVPALLAGRGQGFSAIPSSVLFGPLSDALAALG